MLGSTLLNLVLYKFAKYIGASYSKFVVLNLVDAVESVLQTSCYIFIYFKYLHVDWLTFKIILYIGS